LSWVAWADIGAIALTELLCYGVDAIAAELEESMRSCLLSPRRWGKSYALRRVLDGRDVVAAVAASIGADLRVVLGDVDLRPTGLRC